ncbi:hypothetical protein ABH932_000815 [Streptacidiphilus sp. MAP5-52]
MWVRDRLKGIPDRRARLAHSRGRGLPPSDNAIVSPCDPPLQPRGHATCWKGYLTHVTESCNDDAVNVITNVAPTEAPDSDSRAMPAQHLIGTGYTTLVHQENECSPLKNRGQSG